MCNGRIFVWIVYIIYIIMDSVFSLNRDVYYFTAIFPAFSGVWHPYLWVDFCSATSEDVLQWRHSYSVVKVSSSLSLCCLVLFSHLIIIQTFMKYLDFSQLSSTIYRVFESFDIETYDSWYQQVKDFVEVIIRWSPYSKELWGKFLVWRKNNQKILTKLKLKAE